MGHFGKPPVHHSPVAVKKLRAGENYHTPKRVTSIYCCGDLSKPPW
jgi:hypothetical protein